MPKKTSKGIKIVKPLILAASSLLLIFLVVSLIATRDWQTDQNWQVAFWTGQQGGLISLQPQLNRLVVFVFPNNTLISTAKGFGDYQAKAIYNLGEQEKLGGGQFWQLSLQNFFGFLIDDYLVNFSNQAVNQANINSWFLKAALGRKDSLGFLDSLRAWWFIKKISANGFKLINLAEAGQIKLACLADQTEVYQANQEKIDQLMKNYLVEPVIAQGSLRWVIFNSSGFDGAGSFWARIIENSGGRVVHLGNERQLERSVIKLASPDFQQDFLVNKLVKEFGFETKIEPTIFSGRGDVGIYIGQDLVNRYLIN